MSEFEREFNRALFGTDHEPSWDDLRSGARANLMDAEGVDPGAARKIWETNEALPPALRQTDPRLIDRYQGRAQLDAETEEKLASLPGPRITKEDIAKAIAKADYHHFDGTMTTVCCLTLYNGFTVVGSSSCADPQNFREEIGKNLAYEDAATSVWHLLGFQLRERLYQSALALSMASAAHALPDLEPARSTSGGETSGQGVAAAAAGDARRD